MKMGSKADKYIIHTYKYHIK